MFKKEKKRKEAGKNRGWYRARDQPPAESPGREPANRALVKLCGVILHAVDEAGI